MKESGRNNERKKGRDEESYGMERMVVHHATWGRELQD